MTYKIGSLFDGSGGFPLAGSLCGVEPCWASEVEPYPIAVTRSRFPKMKHLGDISKIDGAEIEPVDIITFGSPCQDLSVAGKQAGIKHAENGDEETTRSGLFIEAVRIAKEMRRKTNGQYPKFMLWENVPGAFSSNKGEDFRIVLEELVKIVEPSATMPSVPKGGWAYADSYRGDEWSLAYRVFDAQFWGVPQRRRRIHLVLDLTGQRARDVLFKREGVRGYFAPSGTQGQGTPTTSEEGVGANDRTGEAGRGLDELTGETYILDNIGGQAKYGKKSNVNGTLRAGAQGAVVYSVENHANDSRVNIDDSGKVQTLTSRMGTGGGNVPMVMEPKVFENHSQDTRYTGPLEVAQTVSATYGMGGNNQPFVVEPSPVYCLQGNGIDRADTAGCNGKGWRENECYTLNTIDRPAVAYKPMSLEVFHLTTEEDKVQTLKARDYKDPICVAEPIGLGLQSSSGIGAIGENVSPCLINGDNPGWQNGVMHQDKVGALCARDCKGVESQHVYEWHNQDNRITGPIDVACTLNTNAGGREGHLVAYQDSPYIVRRLTPTECARLQGFPDSWGNIAHKKELTEDEYRFWLEVRNTYAAINGKTVKDYTEKQMLTWYNKLHTDSAEYKMWGNGIALPPALYVLQGIVDALDSDNDNDWMN